MSPPASDELTNGFMKMEQMNSLKKSQKKVSAHIYNTLNRPAAAAPNGLNSHAAHDGSEELIKATDMSGGQKHRRLHQNTAEPQKIMTGARAVEHSSQIELPPSNLEQIGISDEQRKYLQERRARSSLSNRHIS